MMYPRPPQPHRLSADAESRCPFLNRVPRNVLTPIRWGARTKSSIAQRLAPLVNSEAHADFHFIIEEDGGRRIPAHKLIVASGSEELHNIVYGTALLPATKDTSQVDDCGSESFIELLRYLYTDECSINTENAFEILRKANYYGLTQLQDRCSDMLIAHLHYDYCLPIFAHVYPVASFPHLVRACLQLIRYRPQRVALQHENWPDCPPSVLQVILGDDTINAGEPELFEALVSWARQRCERRARPQQQQQPPDAELEPIEISVQALRAEMGDLYECIRWGTMSTADFERCTGQVVAGLFSAAEVQRLRVRCRATEQRRRPLTCANAEWREYSGIEEDVPAGAFFLGMSVDTPIVPHYVGRRTKNSVYENRGIPGAERHVYYSVEVKQWGQRRGRRQRTHPEVVGNQQVLMGDGYEWVPFDETGEQLPWGAVVMNNEALSAAPVFVGRRGSYLFDVQLYPQLEHSEKRHVCREFDVLVGRDVLQSFTNKSEQIPADAHHLVTRRADNVPLYLGIAFCDSDLLPALIDHAAKLATCTFDTTQRTSDNYAFVRAPAVDQIEWLASSGGAILPLAVPCGRTISNEKLYVGRVPEPDGENLLGWRYGKVHPSHGVLYVGSPEGVEVAHRDYQIMVYRETPTEIVVAGAEEQDH